jgi:hypothetical protein
VRPHERPEVAALAAALALWALAGCSCGSDETAQPGKDSGGAPDGHVETGAGGAAGSAADAGTDAAVPCPAEPKPAGIPDGWIKFPGLPCSCDVWIAPDESLMGPAPGWITTPPGVLEMEVNWAGPAHRFYSGTAVGDEFEGVQYIGFLRDMGNKVQEVVVFRYPEARTVSRARLPSGFQSKCGVRIAAIRQGVGHFYGFQSTAGLEPATYVLAVGTPPNGAPDAIHVAVESPGPQEFAAAREAVGWVHAPNNRLDAFELNPIKKHLYAWTSTDGRTVQSDTLTGWDKALFFGLWSGPPTSEIWSWDPSHGAEPFLKTTGLQVGQIGSTCGLGTDGQWMVWTQASGWNGTTWNDIDIMKGGHTTNASELQASTPSKLRNAPGGSGSCLPWTVGSGYAGTYQKIGKNADSSEHRVVLVRLSDGVMWEIPDRPERKFGRPLYITKEEVVMAEGLTLPNDAGVTEFESWSIVRYPISLLGAGIPP